MPDDPLLVGVDFGTTTIKAIAFTTDGRQVAYAGRKTPTRVPQPGWAYYEPEELWSLTVEAIRELCSRLSDAQRVVSIAFASLGETGVLLNAAGKPLTEAIAWFDRRTLPQVDQLREHPGSDRIFATTGLSLQPIFSLPKLLWHKQNQQEIWQQARHWLNAAEYLAYRLSGEKATDFSLASRTLMLDLARLTWDIDLLRSVDVSDSLLAPLTESGTALGGVCPEAAAATGLPAHTVVGVGGHDHVCGAFALGVTDEGHVLDSMGTAEGIFLPTDEPLSDPDVGTLGYSQGAHVAGGYYGLGGLYTSGICADWFRSNFANGANFGQLASEAQQVAPGSLGVFFLPHLRLPNPGYASPNTRGTFLGLTTDVDRGILYRALLEGVAYEARHSVETLLGHSQLKEIDRISVTGGGTRNRLLLEIKAAVFNRTLDLVSIDEATALGAALLGGVAAGIFPDKASAAQAVHYDSTEIMPNVAAAEHYNHDYSTVYSKIGQTLLPLFPAASQS